MKNFIKPFLWILPFISFLAGYQFVRMLSHTEVIEVPNIVGMHMSDAIKILSTFQLNARILAEKEDPDAHEGIILSQTPVYGKKVKPHQSIFLVVTRRPPKPHAPALFGMKQQDAAAKAQKERVALKVYPLESQYPSGTVIAQNAQPQQELADSSLSVYVSAGASSMRLMPDLKDHSVEEVTKFFAPYQITVESTHVGEQEGHKCAACIVTEQKPAAGTPIDLKKPPVVQVTATAQS